MVEKRKQPTRAGREPTNKKRASDATAPQPQSRKKKAATPRAPTPAPEPVQPVEPPLPSSIKDSDALPIGRAPQATNLSDNDYQSIAESAVLLTALEKSKKKWLSDGILVRYYTKPKKTKREQIEKLNPPKESMVKVGLCDVTVGPHLFDAMLYTVKDPTAPQQIQYTPTQAQGPTRMVHYGPGNNFQQHQPYNQQRRPPYPPGPPGRPQNYQGNYSPAALRAPHTPGHPVTPRPGQRPQPQTQPGQPAKPSPDPVIQMLATRAAADPDLKALMRVVASSQASQEQLRAFQAHIDELNAIIKAREQQEKRQQASTATPTQAPAALISTPKPNPPSTPAQSKPAPSAQPSQDSTSNQQPTPQPTSSIQTPGQDTKSQQASEVQGSGSSKSQSGGTPQSGSRPPTPGPTQKNQPPSASQKPDSANKQDPVTSGTTGTQQPLQPNPAPVAPAASTPVGNQQNAPVHPTPPIKSSPQSTPRSGPPYPQYQQPAYGSQPPLQSRPPQYGSPMPYHRQPATPIPPPRPSFKSVVFEFTSPLTPYGSSTSGHAGSGDRYLFPEHSILEWLPNENTILASFLVIRKVDPNVPFPIEPAPDPANSRGKGKGTSKSKKGKGKEEPAAVTSKVEPSDSSGLQAVPEKSAEPVVLKEYWQPVTFRIHAADTRILEPLTRVVKPADEVRRYMNEIMDRAERAPDGFLAMRLPKEDAVELTEMDETNANIAPPGHRTSRSGPVKDESEPENNILDIMEEEEELLDFYGDPMALPPLRV